MHIDAFLSGEVTARPAGPSARGGGGAPSMESAGRAPVLNLSRARGMFAEGERNLPAEGRDATNAH